MFSELTTEGIIFVTFAWGIVGTLVVYCMIKVLRGETDLEKAAEKKKKIL